MKKIRVFEAINTLTAMYSKDVFSFNWRFAKDNGIEYFELKGDALTKTFTRTGLFFYPKKNYDGFDSFNLEADVLNCFVKTIFLYPEDNEICIRYIREGEEE